MGTMSKHKHRLSPEESRRESRQFARTMVGMSHRLRDELEVELQQRDDFWRESIQGQIQELVASAERLLAKEITPPVTVREGRTPD